MKMKNIEKGIEKLPYIFEHPIFLAEDKEGCLKYSYHNPFYHRQFQKIHFNVSDKIYGDGRCF